MVEIDKPQRFEEAHLEYTPQSCLMEIIFDWAKKLPPSPQGIIDLVAGYGIEVEQLRSHGIPCLGQDASSYMIQHACTPLLRLGTAENLQQYPDRAFSGAFLKDSWILLSPLQRVAMLKHLRRVLITDGSLLIVSELKPEYTACYFANQDYLTYSNPNYAEWKAEVNRLKRNSKIGSLFYLSTPGNTRKYAQGQGFTFELVCQFSKDDILAKESRWAHSPGFIAQLVMQE